MCRLLCNGEQEHLYGVWWLSLLPVYVLKLAEFHQFTVSRSAGIFCKLFDSCSLWGSLVSAFQALIEFSGLLSRRLGHAYCHKNIFQPDVKRYFDKKSSCCLKASAASPEICKTVCWMTAGKDRLSFSKEELWIRAQKKSVCNYNNLWQIHCNKNAPQNSPLFFNSVPSLNTLYVLIILYAISEHWTHSKHQRITISKMRHWGFIFASALQDKCVFFSLFRAQCPQNRLQWIQLSNKPAVLFSHAREIKIFAFFMASVKNPEPHCYQGEKN